MFWFEGARGALTALSSPLLWNIYEHVTLPASCPYSFPSQARSPATLEDVIIAGDGQQQTEQERVERSIM